MCGIVGGVTQRPVTNILIDGLKRLEYRGYDSAGLSLISDDKKITTIRTAGKVSQLSQLTATHSLSETIGIAHTRWATHGAPSQNNAHPHTSQARVTIVHNGIIENYVDLRQQLLDKGYQFTSDTDSEVIAHLLADISETEADCARALNLTTQQLKGAYAICALSTSHPGTLYATRRGSPLAIGLGFEENFVASDPLALLAVTQRFIYLEEGDIARIQHNNIDLFDAHFNPCTRPVKETALTATQAEKGKHRHYMIKEIYEQPQVITDTLQSAIKHGRIELSAFGQQAETLLKTIKRIHIVACGTSLNAGHVAKHWLERHAKIPCRVEIASEHRYRHHAIEEHTLFLALSQSGETADTLAALRQAKHNGYHATLAICNVPESSIARESDLVFLTQAGSEIGVAATKTFTAQLIALACLSVGLCQIKQHSDEQISKHIQAMTSLPKDVQNLLEIESTMEELATQFIHKHHTLFLGRGKQYAIAREAALKLKEISYIHAESYASGELKHGPIALIDESMPVVILAPHNELIDKILSNTKEVQARGGNLFIFSDYTLPQPDYQQVTHIRMPKTQDFVSPILYNIPMQLLAYHVAVMKGTDVDQPRNLAKSVTVE